MSKLATISMGVKYGKKVDKSLVYHYMHHAVFVYRYIVRRGCQNGNRRWTIRKGNHDRPIRN